MMRVLAALDQSAHAAYALDYLKQLPCGKEIELLLVTVAAPIPTYDLTGTGIMVDSRELMELELKAIQERLDETAASVRADFSSVETITTIGSPGREIVRLVKGHRCELVVLGAIGHSAIARVVLGSVSDYVATHAACSALVVRPPRHEKVRSTTDNLLPDTRPPGRVLIAISSAETDEAVAKWIEQLSLPKSTQIELVHVMEIPPYYEIDLLHKASAYWKEARSVAAKITERLQEKFESGGFTTHSRLIESEHIGKALLEFAEKEDCDLIITGDQHETVMERFFLGSTSRHVLRHAHCNVMISR